MYALVVFATCVFAEGWFVGMEVNGYKIEPGANLSGTNIEGITLRSSTMPAGTIHD